jgi:predicted Zn-dependent protease
MLRQELFVSAGKLKEAENEIQQAVNKYPENIELLRLEAQFLMDNNKVKDALPTLKRLTMIDNDPSYAFYALARAYQENGLYDSAHDALMGLKKSHPNEPQVEQLISQNELMRNQHKPAAIPK